MTVITLLGQKNNSAQETYNKTALGNQFYFCNLHFLSLTRPKTVNAVVIFFHGGSEYLDLFIFIMSNYEYEKVFLNTLLRNCAHVHTW